jgi:hypothetical protein
MGYPQDYDKLTPMQGELLADIVRCVKSIGDEPRLIAREERGILRIYTTLDSPPVHKSDWSGAYILLRDLGERGFIQVEPTGNVTTPEAKFALTHKAFSYPKWRKRPRWHRRLSVMWDSWKSEVRGGIITIAVSVGSSLLVTLLTNVLFR